MIYVDEREKDSELFDFLKQCIAENKRDVKAIEQSGLLGNVAFFSEVLDVSSYPIIAEKQQCRKRWHNNALEVCQKAELVFLTSRRTSPTRFLTTRSKVPGKHDVIYSKSEKLY